MYIVIYLKIITNFNIKISSTSSTVAVQFCAIHYDSFSFFGWRSVQCLKRDFINILADFISISTWKMSAHWKQCGFFFAFAWDMERWDICQSVKLCTRLAIVIWFRLSHSNTKQKKTTNKPKSGQQQKSPDVKYQQSAISCA